MDILWVRGRGWESEVRIAKEYSTKKAHLSTQWNQIVLWRAKYSIHYEIQLIKLYSFGFVNKTFNFNHLLLYTSKFHSTSLLHRKLSWTNINKTWCEIIAIKKLDLLTRTGRNQLKNRSKSTRLDEKFGSQCSHQLCLKGSSKIHNRR